MKEITEIPFLNVTDECLKDPQTGYARSEIMYQDGVHIEANGLTDLLMYYRTHAYITDDRRPVKQGSTYVIWSPAEPDTINCSGLLADVSAQLAAGGFDIASGSSDGEGAVRYFYYSVDSSATDDELGAYTEKIVSYVRSSCSPGSRLRITWGDDVNGNHVFTIKEITPCTAHEYGEWTVVTPSTLLGTQYRDDGPSVDYRARLMAAYEYLTGDPECILVATGGKGSNEPCSEAEGARRFLTAIGIREERILIEDRSRNTVQNIQNAYELLTGNGAEPEKIRIVIVSASYHLLRARFLAKQAGFVNVEVKGSTGLPVLMPHFYTREFFALIKDFAMTMLGR